MGKHRGARGAGSKKLAKKHARQDERAITALVRIAGQRRLISEKDYIRFREQRQIDLQRNSTATLWVNEIEDTKIETAIRRAMSNAYKVDINYADWACRKDLNQTASHSPAKQIGAIKCPPLPIEGQTVELPAKGGMIIEDANGLIIAILLKNFYRQETVDMIVQAGIKLSREAKPGHTKVRINHVNVPNRIFKPTSLNYCVWSGQGGDARRPQPASETREARNIPLFHEFFTNDGIVTFLHSVNLVLERLDPSYVDSLIRLKRTYFRHGSNAKYLPDLPCHIPGVVVHWDLACPFHKDGKSLHMGMNVVSGFGPYQNCRMMFPRLGVEFAFDSGDMLLMRDAGIHHQTKGWEGEGRMVMVPVFQRRLYGWAKLKRPQQTRRFMEEHYNGFRKQVPAKSVTALLQAGAPNTEA